MFQHYLQISDFQFVALLDRAFVNKLILMFKKTTSKFTD